MPRDLLTELADRAAAQPRPRPPLPAVRDVRGVRSIPRQCSCTWRPDYRSLPANWTLTGTDPECKTHGEAA